MYCASVVTVMSIDCHSDRRYGLIVIVGFLCVSVFAQMLGMPGSVIDLVSHSVIAAAAVSEDVSLTPLTPEPGASELNRLRVIVNPAIQLPVLVTSVFHPPLT